MTLRHFLEQRRLELVEFLNWRFATKYWAKPLLYCTGLPADLWRRLRASPISYLPGSRGLTVWDIQRAEDAVMHLGFRPKIPRKKGINKKYSKPPPMNLPRWSEKGVRVRFYQWRRETFKNERERVRKYQLERRLQAARGEIRKPENDLRGSVDPTLLPEA
jgi:hypothetical protein